MFIPIANSHKGLIGDFLAWLSCIGLYGDKQLCGGRYTMVTIRNTDYCNAA